VDGDRRIPSAADSTPYDEIVRRYRTLVEQLPLIVYVDELDASSSNIFTSPQIEPILGYTVEEWATDETLFVRALHPGDRERVLAAHARTHKTHEPLSVEYRLLSRDGEIVWIRDEGVVVVDESGTPLYLQGYLLDITREREAQIQLRQLALYDPLTGLANRAFFHEQLQQAAAQRHEPHREAALLFVDLNDFKSVNDRYGHDVGDSVLKALGSRIQRAIRAGDAAARLGGDEFAVLLTTGVEPAEAVKAAERLLHAISEPVGLERGQLSITASIGIALGSDADDMLKQADAAMYRAKAQRDVGYAFFDPVLDRSAVHRSRRIAELREGLDRGEFTLHYQPLVDLETQEISGYEALVRWDHPTEGELGPLEFIPLAEETGLIIPIGNWVLDEACARGAELHAEHGREVGMSVNVSARQFQHPDFVSHLERALRKSGFPPRCLMLELTESVLLTAGSLLEQRLSTLKETGVTLALDDFGTGYASLSYLQRFPVDVVKIDRSFIAEIDDASTDLVLLKGIIDLSKGLGLNLVAEGVETKEQHHIVRRLGCHGAQGFYFGYPTQVAQRDLTAGNGSRPTRTTRSSSDAEPSKHSRR
jgi:diguanylate cyclase (GGDEF)-like protein/PAS domain S-box-containing protein